MSMLAEPRRKKAWILNPRRSQWAEDESKFGQKMLEQMGWSKGKGLGRELTGITEHIRPSIQNDSRGLGYEGRSDDWVAHLDNFNDLLANLQQDQKEADKEDAKTSVKSLEERSKKSRARVHYHKFTRGKDLSRYSSADLACILGGRAEGSAASQPATPVSSRPPSPPPHADSEPASDAETQPAAAPTAERDASSGYTTINTGLSVKDYFAAKMRKMKMLKIKHQRDDDDAESCAQKPRDDAMEDVNLQCPEEAENLEQVEKRSKKRKKRHASILEETLPAVSEKNTASEEPKKKKRKKRKNLGNDQEEGTEEDAGESSPVTVKRESPAKQNVPAGDGSGDEPSADIGEVREKKKKKKKRKKSSLKRSEDSD